MNDVTPDGETKDNRKLMETDFQASTNITKKNPGGKSKSKAQIIVKIHNVDAILMCVIVLIVKHVQKYILFEDSQKTLFAISIQDEKTLYKT